MQLNGQFYSHLKQRLARDKRSLEYNDADHECVQRTAAKLLDPGAFGTSNEKPGLLLGKIQSGKTKAFIGVMGLLFDNGFDVTVVLTKNSEPLSRQTAERMGKVFKPLHRKEIFVYDAIDCRARFAPAAKHKKVIFIAKKEKTNIQNLIRYLADDGAEFKGKRVLIVDDEADNATVGFKKTEGGLNLAKIPDMINTLRQKLEVNSPGSVSFLQVTATPYSLFLQNENEAIYDKPDTLPLRPSFVELVPVNKGYVGGDEYFVRSLDDNDVASRIYIPVEQSELDSLSHPPHRNSFKIESDCLTSPRVAGLRGAIARFAVSGCIRIIQQKEVLSGEADNFTFLVHTEAVKSSHEWQDLLAKGIRDAFRREVVKPSMGKAAQILREAYDDIVVSLEIARKPIPSFAMIAEFMPVAFEQWMDVITVNSDQDILLNEDGELLVESPLTLFIGGQYLDRGVTIQNLLGFYYGRSPDSFQQDTVLQHCRMFGFRHELDFTVTRFYTSPEIYKVLNRMHETDTKLRLDILEFNKRRDAGADARFDALYFLSGHGAPDKAKSKSKATKISFCNFAKVKASRLRLISHEKTKIYPELFDTKSTTDLKKINKSIERVLLKYGMGPGGAEKAMITREDAFEIVEATDAMISDYMDGYEDTWVARDVKGLIDRMVGPDCAPYPVVLMVKRGLDRPRYIKVGKKDSPDHPKNDTPRARHAAKDGPVLMLFEQNGCHDYPISDSRSLDDWHGGPFWWPVFFPKVDPRGYIYAVGNAPKRRRLKG